MSINGNSIFLPDNSKLLLSSGSSHEVSDGAHTFKELYDHRTALMLCIMSYTIKDSWFSRLDENGNKCDPYILVGTKLSKTKLSISYHIDKVYEDTLILMGVNRLVYAPEYDGYLSGDVLSRLLEESIIS